MGVKLEVRTEYEVVYLEYGENAKTSFHTDEDFFYLYVAEDGDDDAILRMMVANREFVHFRVLD